MIYRSANPEMPFSFIQIKDDILPDKDKLQVFPSLSLLLQVILFILTPFPS